jgi:hypothetical protein
VTLPQQGVRPNRISTFAEQSDLLADMLHKRAQIEAALAEGLGAHTFADVCVMALSGRLHWWSVGGSFALTEIVAYPREAHYHIFLGGGDLPDLLGLWEAAQKVARDAGCSRITIAGRPGWAKVLNGHGFRQVGVIYSSGVLCGAVDDQEDQDGAWRLADDHGEASEAP